MSLKILKAQLRAAGSMQAMTDVMSSYVKSLGYNGFDAYSLAKTDIDNPTVPSNAFTCDYGVDRVAAYFTEGWLQMDPSLQEVGRSFAPFDYVAYLKSCPSNGSVLWQKAILLTMGVRRAWCVPANTTDRIQGMTWYMRGSGKDREELFHDTVYDVQVASTVFQERFLAQAIEDKARQMVANAPDNLTAREGDCLHWVAQGKTNWEIATILAISENTVRYHLKNAFRKLGANTRGVAVNRAIRAGVVS